MKSVTSAINVQVNTSDKELASKILQDLGLNMSTFINMAIKQVIKHNGVPFEVSNPKPSHELLMALNEGKKIIHDMETGKKQGYNNIDDLFKSLDDWNEINC